ncbi:peptidylprolyl isomerase [Euryarchaeota archaeon]|nr:peptidylprolyl isomerase [Euryarchaeota archaeon]
MFDTMKVKVLFAVLLVLIPGCIEGVDEEFPSSNWAFDPMYNGTYSNVSLNLFQGESLQNATATYTITIMLNHTAAPVHADNMLKHIEAGNYNMSTFHRIIDDFMIQGGDFENHDGSGGYAADWYGYCGGQSASNQSECEQTSWTIPDEADNGLMHYPCVISMAKTSQANTGGSQFFLIPDDIQHHYWLDGVHTVFGQITEGCEHVTTLSEVSTEPSDRPVSPVVLYSATIN